MQTVKIVAEAITYTLVLSLCHLKLGAVFQTIWRHFLLLRCAGNVYLIFRSDQVKFTSESADVLALHPGQEFSAQGETLNVINALSHKAVNTFFFF